MSFRSLIILCFTFFLTLAINANERQILDSLKLEISISETPQNKILLLVEASKEARNLSLTKEAILFSKEAVELARAENLIKEQVMANKELAYAYLDHNDLKKAFSLANKAKELADENAYDLESALVSQLLSQLYFMIAEYDKSVELSFTALKILEEFKDYYKISTSLEQIGRNYALMGKDSLGRVYFLKAIKMARTHGNYKALGVSMVNLSNSYYLKKQNEEAIVILKEGCKVLLIHKENASAIGTGYGNIALNYLGLKQYDSTFVYLEKSRLFNLRINNLRNLLNTHNAYAFYYQKINEEQKFLEHANLSYHIAEGNDFIFEQRIISVMLEEYYLSHNEIDSAYKYRCIRHDISEIINSQNTLSKLAQLEMVKELELAEKENALIQRKRTFINTVVFIVLLSLLILAIVLLRNYRTQMKFSKLKQEKLEDDISFKSKEMTIQLMDLTKRNELLADITKELISVSKGAHKEETKSAINKIAVDIEKATEGKIWEDFILRFKEVHSGFYSRLIQKFPDLTPNEQRLCAFLKLNLSTKEILSMTGQSERSIVMARHRLRKKLGINSQEVNLVTYISKI